MALHTVKTGPGIFVQFLWFIFVGWWLSALWTILAYLFSLTILLLPVSIIMLNKLPQIVALREPRKSLMVVGNTLMEVKTPQHNFILRAIYFLLIGWWLTGIWISIAWALCIIILGMPLGFIMFDMTPSVQTLRKRPPNLMVAPTSPAQEPSVSVTVNMHQES